MVWMALGLLAILPGILLVVYIYNKDAVEKEPKGLLIKLFLFGCLSIIPVYFVEGFLQSVYPAFEDGSFAYSLTIGFLCAALVEELFKLVALFIGSWWSKAFDYRFDAIVYAVAIAVGFATIENIMYVFQFGIGTGLIRAVTSIPGHAIFAIFMGYYYSQVKEARVNSRSADGFPAALSAILVPVLLHGIYDYILTLETDASIYLFFGYIIILDIFAYRFLRKASREDEAFRKDGILDRFWL